MAISKKFCLLRPVGLFLALAAATASASAQDTPIKIFLMGGQSNMVGQAPKTGLPASLQGSQEDVLLFGGRNNSVPTAATNIFDLFPFGNTNNEFGPEVTFGRTMADAYPDQQFGLIKYSSNGTSLYEDWSPGSTTEPAGSRYTNFRTTVTNGLAKFESEGYAPEIVGMLWHQGESDADEGQAGNYQTNLTNFIADMRSHYGADLPFMIGEILQVDAASMTVVAAQTAVAAADENATFVPANDLTFLGNMHPDNLHFDAPGMITLGERFATYYQADFSSRIVPEPGSLALLGLGGVMFLRRRR